MKASTTATSKSTAGSNKKKSSSTNESMNMAGSGVATSSSSPIATTTSKATTKAVILEENDNMNTTETSIKTNINGGIIKKNSNTSKTTSTSSSSSSNELMDFVWLSCIMYAFYYIASAAYSIRLGAINEFGPVIHEFDPYFNYRATEYLYWNGSNRFFKWFDAKVWYPLGRPVGTTIYPGMQFTAVFIKNHILNGKFLTLMSLNDICCYIPAWFGVIASIITGLIAYECTIPANTTSNLWQYLYQLFVLLATGNKPNQSTTTKAVSSFLGFTSPATECGLAAMAMMSIVPAHLMRSMGGGYDNESIAVTAMVLTFYFWIRSLRTNDPNAFWYSIITGLAYFFMVATWGGYVFVINLIGVHALVLVLMGRFDTKTIYRSYSIFFVIGTSLAIQVPVVGYAPLKSLEQLGPFAVFVGYQLLFVTETVIQFKKSVWTRKQCYTFRAQVFGTTALIAIVASFVLLPTGYFGPFSSRIRGLFVKHTKTGNPLVDSVAEHQPASGRAYFQYLHHVCSIAPVGFIITLFQLSDANSFLIVWGVTAYFFSHKMVRLILLTAPIGSALGGIAAGQLLVLCIKQWWDSSAADNNGNSSNQDSTDDNDEFGVGGGKKSMKTGPGAGKKVKKSGPGQTQRPLSSKSSAASNGTSFDGLLTLQDTLDTFSKTKEGLIVRRTMSFIVLVVFYMASTTFIKYCWRLQQDLANPTIILKARRRDNVIIKVDDYREAYWWLRDNTPEDSRIMAWWDYGYQISAIANRTTLADGNTWNHEHIALLGKALTSELEDGWEIARHLADYVLVWGGGGGDDLAKSPHLARIANSVYRDHCPDDPTCRAFGMVDRQGTPSSMMRNSLLYRLHGFQIKPEVEVPDDKFVEVYRSQYGKVRIYKIIGVSEESKQWVEDTRNKKCDYPGSWFCPGQYPPGLKNILARKTDFRQLEDFNKAGQNDNEYQQQYFRDLQDPEAARRKILEKEHKERVKEEQHGMSEDEKRRQIQKRDEIYSTWSDTEDTTMMWRLISTDDIDGLRSWMEVEPNKAFIRSKDGRGPMWWAFEQRNEEITKLLMKAGVPHTDVDTKGLSPMDLLDKS